MNFKTVKVALFAGIIVISTSINAQNSNVVSAAIEYKKYLPELMSGNVEGAKKVLMEAKSFIDPAMKHEDTKDDPKAHYYNGVIHFGLIELSAQDEALKEYQNEETMEMIEKSFKVALDSRKYKRDVEDFVNQRVSQASMFGQQAFEAKNFEMAYQLFVGASELQGMIDEEDDGMKNNAIISARNHIDTLKKQAEADAVAESKKEILDNAITFIEQASHQFPKNSDIAIQGVNIALDMGNLDKAEQFFNAAAEADPQNKALFSTMGSIYLASADEEYTELQGMDITDANYPAKAEEVEALYTKAEDNLKKALEIDPEYLDASYNLGVLYLGRGQKIEQTAKQMEYNDPNYESTMKRSEEMYKKAIEPLEMYIKQDPNNAGVLQVLFQVHRRAGNTDKAVEYKKRFDAAQGQ